MITVTTHADTPPSGFWADELKKARAVRDGEVQLAGYAPVLYEPPKALLDDDQAIYDPKTWAFGNPNLDVSVSGEWLEKSFEDAKLAGNDEVNRWLSQHANIEVKTHRLVDAAWSAAKLWPAAKSKLVADLDDLLDAAEYLTLGIDGGGLDDLLSLCVIGKLQGGKWVAWQKSWIQVKGVATRSGNEGLYSDFESAGDLDICNAGDDVEGLVQLISYINSRADVFAVGVDPAGIAAEIAAQLVSAGIPREKLVQVPQGFRLGPAMISIGRRLNENKLHHTGQPLFDWAMSNAQLNERGFLSKADTHGKIDPVIALLCAAMVALEAEQVVVEAEGSGEQQEVNGWVDPVNFWAIQEGGDFFSVWLEEHSTGGDLIYRSFGK